MKYVKLFKSLFTNHEDELRRYVTGKMGNSADAEEIVQDAFHNFMQIDEPDQLENPRAYLYRTAHNLALNRIRKEKRHQDYASAQDADPSTVSLERSLIARADLENIEQALNELPERSREVFLLNRIEGLTYNEISQQLGISVSSVEKHMMKTLNFLRSHIED